MTSAMYNRVGKKWRCYSCCWQSRMNAAVCRFPAIYPFKVEGHAGDRRAVLLVLLEPTEEKRRVIRYSASYLENATAFPHSHRTITTMSLIKVENKYRRTGKILHADQFPASLALTYTQSLLFRLNL
jgi:hypothetical protein